jgi:thioredoxin 1
MPMRVVATTRVAAVLVAGALLAACEAAAPASPAPNAGRSLESASVAAVPRLVDLGAGKCIPCKAMAPILEGLRVEYAGRMDVQFIDVWLEPEAARRFGIRMIPTQIFYDRDGKELARHEGFMARDAILAQWRALGVEP